MMTGGKTTKLVHADAHGVATPNGKEKAEEAGRLSKKPKLEFQVKNVSTKVLTLQHLQGQLH